MAEQIEERQLTDDSGIIKEMTQDGAEDATIPTTKVQKVKIDQTSLELFAEAHQQKTFGNDKFKAKDYKEAVDMYNEAIESLDKMKSLDDNEEMQKLRISCLQNASICHNSMGHFAQTVDKCTKVIQLDKNAVKAFYLRSVAHTKLQNFEEALTDIQEAIKLSPSDKKLRQDFESIKAEKMKHSQSQDGAETTANNKPIPAVDFFPQKPVEASGISREDMMKVLGRGKEPPAFMKDISDEEVAMLYNMHMSMGGAEQDPVQRKKNLETQFDSLMKNPGVGVKYETVISKKPLGE